MARLFYDAIAALLVAGAATGTNAAVAVIPDNGYFESFGTGDATITYDGVVFSSSAALDPTATLFNVSPGFSGATKPVVSSQDQPGNTVNILITLPYAVTRVSFGYGTFSGATVNFLLSNGDAFAFAPAGNNYEVGTLFLASTATAFTTILVTSPDFVLSVGDVTYGLVPEPATWGLMIAGFGLAGFAMRRRVAVAA